MKYYEIPHTNMRQSAVIQGCMRFKGMSSTEVEQIVNLCLENGINSFDHADVYGTAGMRGECEQLFGQVLKENPGLRDKVYIPSVRANRIITTFQRNIFWRLWMEY